MIHDLRSPGVVLSPHLDDAVMSAWSTLREPVDVLVHVFTGAPAKGVLSEWDRGFGVVDSSALMELRRSEDVAALAVARRRATNLGFLEAQYRDRPLRLEGIRASVDRSVAGAAWVCAPAGVGAHPDHVLVRELALQINRESSVPVFLYADLPYAVQWGWPHWVTGAEPRAHFAPEARWSLDLESASVPREKLLPEVRILEQEEVALKVRAMRCYSTQFETLNAGPLNRLLHPEIVGFELRWRVE
jgi:LmbE family N-acetylglucosaminyl deacetylase